MTDWHEHNGGPQPVGDDVWVEAWKPWSWDVGKSSHVDERAPAREVPWDYKLRWRILNEHLIDAARLEGIRLGLEAAHKAANAVCEADPESHAEDAIMAVAALDPATIAREATLDTLTAEAQAQGMGYDQHDTKRHPAAPIGQETTND